MKIWNCICHLFARQHTHPRHPSAQLKELFPRCTRLLGHVLLFSGRVRYNLATLPIHIVLSVLPLVFWVKLCPTICGSDAICSSYTILARSREIGRLLLRCSLAGLATLLLGVGFANFTGTALSFARLFEGRLTLVVLGRDIDRGNKSRWDSYYIFALWHSRSVLTRNRWVEWASGSQLSWIRTLTTATRIQRKFFATQAYKPSVALQITEEVVDRYTHSFIRVASAIKFGRPVQ